VVGVLSDQSGAISGNFVGNPAAAGQGQFSVLVERLNRNLSIASGASRKDKKSRNTFAKTGN
jgi:hypothetical protein